MITIGIIAYLVIGLLSARKVKFTLENGVERGNARLKREYDDWEDTRRVVRGEFYPSAPSHYGKQQDCWDNLSGWYVAVPLLGGVLWPVMLSGLVVILATRHGWRIVRAPLVPATKWFFENPAR